MAAESSITSVIDLLRSKDKSEQLRGFAEAERYLDSELVDGDAAPDLVDALVPALSNSNPKFVQEGLGLLVALVEVMGEELAPYTAAVWPPLVERLGDAKTANRERAVDLAVALATLVVAPGQALERIRPAWEHKNWRARESSLLWFGRVLASHDSASTVGFPLKGLLPSLMKPLEDREPPVREAAILAVEQMFRHQGEPLINELRRANVRANVLKPLLERLGIEAPAAAGGLSARGGLHSGSGFSQGSADDDTLSQGSQRSPGARSSASSNDPAAAPHRPPTSARNHDAANGGSSSSRRTASPAPRGAGGASSSRAPSGGSTARGFGGGGWGSAEAAPLVGDADSEVAPWPVYSDKELGGEMATIGDHLRHAEDWTVRSGALRKLHSLILGGACDFDSFATHLKALKEPIVAQLAELRSSLVREACAALGAIAERMHEAFEPFCVEFFPPMLKQTTVTIQVIREASNLGIRTLIVYCTPVKIAPRLLSALSDRSASLRKNAVEYLRLLLEATPAHAEGERCLLEKHADAIATSIKSLLTDQTGEVRATARISFWAYHRHFPTRTARLLPTLDASTHKLLLEEQTLYSQRVARGEVALISGIVHGGSRGAVGGTERPSSRPGSTAGMRPGPPPRASVPPSLQSAAAETEGAAPPTQNRLPPAQRRSHTPTPLSGARRVAPSATPAAAESHGPYGAHSARGSARGAGGSYAAAHAAAAASGEDAALPPRVTRGSEDMPVRGAARGSTAREVAAAAAAAAEESSSYAERAPTERAERPPTDRYASERAERVPLERANSFERRGAPSSASAALAAEGGEDSVPLEDAPTVLAKAGSPVWSVRATALNELVALMKSDRRTEVGAIADKVVALVLDKVQDAHYRVVHCALNTVCTLAAVFPNALEPALERLLPFVMVRSTENKDALRAVAHAALQAVQTAFSPEMLLPILLRVLDNPGPRVKAGALQLIASAAPGAPQYVATPSHMRGIVGKAHTHLGDKSTDLRRASLAALQALYEAAPQSFVGQVCTLAPPAQNQIKTLMAQRLPSIEAELAAASKQRKATIAQQPPPSNGNGYHSERAPPTPSAAAQPPPPPPAPPEPVVQPKASPKPSARPLSAVAAAGYKGDDYYMSDAYAAGVGSSASSVSGSQEMPTVGALAALLSAEARVGSAPDPACRPLQPTNQLTTNQNPASHSPAGQLLPSAAEDWLALMPQLLRQLAGNSGASSHREALLKMQKMALCAPADASVWSAHFEHALEATLRVLQNPDDKLRELGMAVVKDMLRSQAKRFKAFTEHVLLRLLSAGRDNSREVCVAAEEALELLLSLSDAHRCMAVLVPVVMKEAPPTLQLAVRLQSKLVPRFSQLQLLAILPQVLPPLFEAFKNPNADVRKAVVFCLVDMYMVLGEQLTPHLAVLSTSQLKLVTIYINRTAKARADRDISSPEGATSAFATNSAPHATPHAAGLIASHVAPVS